MYGIASYFPPNIFFDRIDRINRIPTLFIEKSHPVDPVNPVEFSLQ
jgi:hypothetical protein